MQTIFSFPIKPFTNKKKAIDAIPTMQITLYPLKNIKSEYTLSVEIKKPNRK
jgi:hypothetical protein